MASVAVSLLLDSTAQLPGKGLFKMNTHKVRAGIRTFGRVVFSPLAEMERTVEFAAHWQRHLIRTDALPDARRERRGAR